MVRPSDVIPHLEKFYSSTAVGNDNPNYIGKRDRDLVNKHEKYEVASFIAEVLNKKCCYVATRENVRTIERKLHTSHSNSRSFLLLVC